MTIYKLVQLFFGENFKIHEPSSKIKLSKNKPDKSNRNEIQNFHPNAVIWYCHLQIMSLKIHNALERILS